MDVLWKPHPGPQENFCSRGEFEVLYGGSAGPGKTSCLVIEAIRYVGVPGYKALILRRTFPQLQEIIDRCWDYYPALGGIYKATEHRWYFPSGAFVVLGHMQHENDKYNYQGKEFHFVGFDELTQFLESQYLYLHSRCRTVNPAIIPRIRSTTNPGGIGHVWVKSRFYSPMPAGTAYVDPETGLSRVFIPGRIEDNPTIIENDPLYVKRLLNLPLVERMRLLEGNWDIFEGQCFRELDQAVHGCEPFPIPEHWKKYCAFDWGFAKPFSVGWYAQDHDGTLYRYREWYGCKNGEEDVGIRLETRKIAEGILEREKEKVSLRVADPAIWNRVPLPGGGQGPSVQEDMAKQGVYFVKANNDRLQGKLQVHARMGMDVETGSDGEITASYPRLKVFNTCTHFWRTMLSLQEDPRKPEDVDTDSEDHVYDEFRYMCMQRMVKTRVEKKAPAGTFQAERRRLIKARKYARQRGVSLASAYTTVR